MSIAPTPQRTPGTPVTGAGTGSQHAVVQTMLRSALWPAFIALVAVGLGFGLASGWASGAAAAGGGLLAVAAFWSGMIGIQWVLGVAPGFAVLGALGLYAVQVLLLVALALVLRDQSWLDGLAFGVGLLATGLAYQVGQVRGFLRARTLVVDAPAPGERR